MLPCHSHTDAYKNKLEDILNDVILISEIADLSVESAHIANEIGIKEADIKASPTNETTPVTEAKVQRLNRPRWSIVRFDGDSSIKSKSSSGVIEDGEDEGEEPHDFYFADEDSDCAVKGGFYESSCRLPIKDLLDKWEEPVSKRDQVSFQGRFVDCNGSIVRKWHVCGGLGLTSLCIHSYPVVRRHRQ